MVPAAFVSRCFALLRKFEDTPVSELYDPDGTGISFGDATTLPLMLNVLVTINCNAVEYLVDPVCQCIVVRGLLRCVDKMVSDCDGMRGVDGSCVRRHAVVVAAVHMALLTTAFPPYPSALIITATGERPMFSCDTISLALRLLSRVGTYPKTLAFVDKVLDRAVQRCIVERMHGGGAAASSRLMCLEAVCNFAYCHFVLHQPTTTDPVPSAVTHSHTMRIARSLHYFTIAVGASDSVASRTLNDVVREISFRLIALTPGIGAKLCDKAAWLAWIPRVCNRAWDELVDTMAITRAELRARPHGAPGIIMKLEYVAARHNCMLECFDALRLSMGCHVRACAVKLMASMALTQTKAVRRAHGAVPNHVLATMGYSIGDSDDCYSSDAARIRALRRSADILHACSNRACACVDGDSEGAIVTRRCGEVECGCPARYCSRECQVADWRAGHREAHSTD
jgi:hypothetical protein